MLRSPEIIETTGWGECYDVMTCFSSKVPTSKVFKHWVVKLEEKYIRPSVVLAYLNHRLDEKPDAPAFCEILDGCSGASKESSHGKLSIDDLTTDTIAETIRYFGEPPVYFHSSTGHLCYQPKSKSIGLSLKELTRVHNGEVIKYYYGA
jgi:hypothetical protein